MNYKRIVIIVSMITLFAILSASLSACDYYQKGISSSKTKVLLNQAKALEA